MVYYFKQRLTLCSFRNFTASLVLNIKNTQRMLPQYRSFSLTLRYNIKGEALGLELSAGIFQDQTRKNRLFLLFLPQCICASRNDEENVKTIRHGEKGNIWRMRNDYWNVNPTLSGGYGQIHLCCQRQTSIKRDVAVRSTLTSF